MSLYSEITTGAVNFAFTLVNGTVPEQAEACIESNRMFFHRHGIPFRVIPYESTIFGDVGKSGDYHRFKIASEHRRVLYLDWDCRMIELPDLHPDIPLFAPLRESPSVFDGFLFYNGDSPLFKEYFEYHCRTSNNFEACFYFTMNTFFKGRVCLFPEKCFKHLYLGAWALCNQ